MKILIKEELLKMQKGQQVSGYVFIQSYAKQPTKNGGTFIGGKLQAKGDLEFKVWSSSPCFSSMDKEDYSGKICHITASISTWGGTVSLELQDIMEFIGDEEELKVSDFMVDKYNIDSYFGSLESTLKKYVSDNALSVFYMIMDDEEVKERFKLEAAAISHHDNCKSGLLAHTTKVVKTATVVKMYPKIMERVGADLLFLSAALHDIGKIFEYNNGTISENGMIISHMTSGVLFITKYKERIVELLGEDFYVKLLSVISQHAGEYSDRPRTVAAYVLNKLDCLDSCLTSLNQLLEVVEPCMQVSYDSLKLL